mgnify:FL=1|jgi:hypothetical protein
MRGDAGTGENRPSVVGDDPPPSFLVATLARSDCIWAENADVPEPKLPSRGSLLRVEAIAPPA